MAIVEVRQRDSKWAENDGWPYQATAGIRRSCEDGEQV